VSTRIGRLVVDWGIDVCLILAAGCEFSFPHMRQSIRHATRIVDCNCCVGANHFHLVYGADESAASLIRRVARPECEWVRI